jgi:hypothetical protein
MRQQLIMYAPRERGVGVAEPMALAMWAACSTEFSFTSTPTALQNAW